MKRVPTSLKDIATRACERTPLTFDFDASIQEAHNDEAPGSGLFGSMGGTTTKSRTRGPPNALIFETGETQAGETNQAMETNDSGNTSVAIGNAEELDANSKLKRISIVEDNTHYLPTNEIPVEQQRTVWIGNRRNFVIGADTWPAHSPYPCMYDQKRFDGPPYAIPAEYDPTIDQFIDLYGNFCSASCAKAYIALRNGAHATTHAMNLAVFAELVMGQDMSLVGCAPPIETMDRYGAGWTLSQFRQAHASYAPVDHHDRGSASFLMRPIVSQMMQMTKGADPSSLLSIDHSVPVLTHNIWDLPAYRRAQHQAQS